MCATRLPTIPLEGCHWRAGTTSKGLRVFKNSKNSKNSKYFVSSHHPHHRQHHHINVVSFLKPCFLELAPPSET